MIYVGDNEGLNQEGVVGLEKARCIGETFSRSSQQMIGW